MVPPRWVPLSALFEELAMTSVHVSLEELEALDFLQSRV